MINELLIISIYVLMVSAIMAVLNRPRISQYLILFSMTLLLTFSTWCLFFFRTDWIKPLSMHIILFLKYKATFLLGTLNILFLFILSIIVIAIAIYSRSYFYLKNVQGKEGHYWFYLSFSILFLIILFTASNLLLMIISMDIVTIFVAMLIAHERHSRRARSLARLYIIVGITASAFIGLASMNIYREINTLDIMPLHGILSEESMLITSLFLIIGISIKTGLLPFHAWIPKVYSEALAPISALLSGLIVNTGIYGLLLFSTYMLEIPAGVGYILLLMGLASMFYGGIIALAQRDIRRLIAYSTISSNGYIVFSIALSLHLIYDHNNAYILVGSIIFPAILLLTLNYAFGKSLLFLVSGSIESIIRTRDLFKMGSLRKIMSKTYILTIIATLIIIGLPPSIGFIAKTLVHVALLKTDLTFITDLSIAGFMSLLSASYMFKLLFRVFHFETEFTKLHKIIAYKLSDPPTDMLLGMTLLFIPAIMVSIYPQVILPLFTSFASSICSIENIVSYLNVYPLLVLVKTISPLTKMGYMEEVIIIILSLFIIPIISFISYLIWEHIEEISHFIHGITDQLFGKHVPRSLYGIKDGLSAIINSFEENYVATIFLSIVIFILLLIILYIL